MNERIQQMIYNLNEKVGVHWTNEDKLKFAQLIVRECIDKIENEAIQYSEPVWAFELVNDIKDHFGVEE